MVQRGSHRLGADLQVHVCAFLDATERRAAADLLSWRCRLSGDPVSWLLAHGRVGWEELLRTGRVTVTAGDAALGAGFKRLLRNP